MQNRRLAQRRHSACEKASLSSPGRADFHPEKAHYPTPRRSLVRYFPGLPSSYCNENVTATAVAAARNREKALRRAFLPAQRRHYSHVCRATCEARARIIRGELDKLRSQLSSAQTKSSMRETKSRTHSSIALSILPSTLTSRRPRSSPSNANDDIWQKDSLRLSPTNSPLKPKLVSSAPLSPSNRSYQQKVKQKKTVPHAPPRLIAEDRPNCRLRNNEIKADAGHALMGSRVGSGVDVWFRSGLAPDAHSPAPTLVRSARPHALAIVERRSCVSPGHIVRVGITVKSDLVSPSLGLSARKKQKRALHAKQRRRKASRLRSLMKASPA